MTVYEVFSSLAIVLSIIAFTIAWARDTERDNRQLSVEADMEELFARATSQYEASYDGFGAVDERIDALTDALDTKFDEIDASLGTVDQNLNDAAEDMVDLEQQQERLLNYIRAVRNVVKVRVAQREINRAEVPTLFPFPFRLGGNS